MLLFVLLSNFYGNKVQDIQIENYPTKIFLKKTEILFAFSNKDDLVISWPKFISFIDVFLETFLYIMICFSFFLFFFFLISKLYSSYLYYFLSSDYFAPWIFLFYYFLKVEV